MNFSLLPYCKVDGIRTVSDSQIIELFKKTTDEGLDKIVFYEGTIKTDESFLQLAKSQGTFFYLLYKHKDLVGYTWLNRLENKTARQHYCVFKKYWGDSEALGKFTINTFLNQKDKDGVYLLDLLTGYIPAWNERAIKFSLKCGGKTYGEIPNAIYNATAKQSEPAVFIYYTRGDA